jgi:hypothetical protein
MSFVDMRLVYRFVDIHACADHFTQGFLILPLNCRNLVHGNTFGPLQFELISTSSVQLMNTQLFHGSYLQADVTDQVPVGYFAHGCVSDKSKASSMLFRTIDICLQLQDHFRADLPDQTSLTFVCITEDIQQAHMIVKVQISLGKCINLLLA